MTYIIGIIGGSGAVATSFLLQKINEYSINMHKATTDNDFLHTVTISTPLTHLDFKGNSQQDTFTHLLANVHDLERIHCNIIVIACNTLHHHWQQLVNKRKNEHTIILNLPQIICSFVDQSDKKIGILCSEKTRDLDLYRPFLKEHQTIIYPSDFFQQNVNYCINSVIKLDTSEQIKAIFNSSMDYLVNQEVDSIILGCTELSLIKPTKIHSKIYDSVELLAIYLNHHYKDSHESL